MRRSSKDDKFFVGDKGAPSAGAALSYAQGLACHWENEPRSFYVRDALNNAVYRVDRDEDGVVRSYTL